VQSYQEGSRVSVQFKIRGVRQPFEGSVMHSSGFFTKVIFDDGEEWTIDSRKNAITFVETGATAFFRSEVTPEESVSMEQQATDEQLALILQVARLLLSCDGLFIVW
jgi:hypothetical protein